MKAKELGYLGEKIAAEFLCKKNYKILAQNFTIRGGELDIVAKQKNTLVFIEVKTRTSLTYGHGLESIDQLKKLRMQRTINRYLDKNCPNYECDYRIDLIEITLDKESGRYKRIIHIRDVE